MLVCNCQFASELEHLLFCSQIQFGTPFNQIPLLRFIASERNQNILTELNPSPFSLCMASLKPQVPNYKWLLTAPLLLAVVDVVEASLTRTEKPMCIIFASAVQIKVH